MKLSIVVPVYNRADLVGQCLESLKGQSESAIEIIIVDDGSTDGVAQLCQKYVEEDSRFSYFYKKNEGAASARNYGIRRARGDFISFVDSDDVLHQDFSTVFMRCASTSPDAEIISGSRVTSPYVVEFPKIKEDFKKISALELIQKGTTSCTRAFKRDLFLQSPYLFPDNTWAEDNAFIPVLVTRARLILYTESIVYWQRSAKNPEQNTSLSMRCLEDMSKALLYLERHCDDEDMVCNVTTRCIVATYFRLQEINYSIEQFNRDHGMFEVLKLLNRISSISSVRLFPSYGQKAYFLALLFYCKGLTPPLKGLFLYSKLKKYVFNR